MSNFQLAERKQTPIKLELFGPPGAGKTWSALMLATEMGYTKIAFIDTENRSSELYAHRFTFAIADLDPAKYQGKEMVKKFLDFYNEALADGAEVIIIDSATFLWDAVKDYVTLLGGRYTDWGKGTPLWRKIIQMILSSPVHTIVCSRADYQDVVQETEKDGKKTYKVERMGLKADLRKMTDYEFTTVLSMNENHTFMCKKDRTEIFANNMGDGGVPRVMDASVAKAIKVWAGAGKIENQEFKPITSEDIDSMEKSTSKLNCLLPGAVATDKSKVEEVKPAGEVHKPAVRTAIKTPVKKAVEAPVKNPLDEIVPAAKIGGWEDEADAFLIAIEECKEHEQILNISNMVDIFIADNHIQGEAANFLQEATRKRITELEPKY